MARVHSLDVVETEICRSLARSFQSAHINFLIGSGASRPAIPIAGGVEREIATLFEAGEDKRARQKMYEFLVTLQEPMNRLIVGADDQDNSRTLEFYRTFLGTIETILSERRTSILPKQATIFTTNYDLFVEKASASFPALKLNDGFNRGPSINNRMEYSSRTFFNTTYNTGNLYDYKVEIPCINLMKLHGSLSWKKDSEEILFSVATKDLLPVIESDDQIRAFIEDYAVVLPQTAKFRTTLMERTYYELLRIYANELDRENVLLVSFGFSFGDEHIFHITRRALKNPTLKLVAFAFNETDRDSFAARFEGHNNVDIVAPPTREYIDFQRFNDILCGVLPKAGESQ